MPELPEIETITRSLQSLVGLKITRLEIVMPSVIKRMEFPAEDVPGSKIQEIRRRGKFIVIKLEGQKNRPLVPHIVVHLGMSGRFYLAAPKDPREKHTHVVITIDKKQELRYQDPRRFGGVWLVNDPECVFGHMGPEPLGNGLTKKYLREKSQGKKVAIKTFLLDQRILAGIGNIYADEILNRAAISPERPAGSLNDQEINRLYKAIRETLELGIANRGTTFRDYRDGFNLPGGFQHHLRVYGKAGQPCPSCGKPVCRIVIGGRSTHFCDHCQK
ncbi:MAG: bifunctional DNA-formamidopyrimidine glycosylase/DNA-(apurinic or apyrimidinic site) lyase [Ignavibacteriales bacterium]